MGFRTGFRIFCVFDGFYGFFRGCLVFGMVWNGTYPFCVAQYYSFRYTYTQAMGWVIGSIKPTSVPGTYFVKIDWVSEV